MRTSRFSPTVNAGSTADIAFLLLIFFLVTSMIPNDEGISRKLPAKCPPGVDCSIEILPQNLMQVFLNENGELLVNNKPAEIPDLHQLLIEFIDNNGDGSCTYCEGKGLVTASDNPSKAVISISTDRLTPYSEFIAVHDAITKAYFQLRKDFVLKTFKTSPDSLTETQLATVREAYPFLISEAELK